MTLFITFFALWLILVLVEITSRLRHGATLAELHAAGFSEIVSLRWVLVALGMVMHPTIVLLYFGIISLRGIWLVWENFSDNFSWLLIPLCILPPVLGWLMWKLAWVIRLTVNNSARIRPIDVDISSITEGIDSDEMLEVGLEKYPNRIRSLSSPVVVTRVVSFITLAIFIILLMGALTLWSDTSFGHSTIAVISAIRWFYETMVHALHIPDFICYSFTYMGISLSILFTQYNRHYLHLSFPKTCVLFGILIFCIGIGFYRAEATSLAFMFVVALAIPSYRLFKDLKQLKNYKIRCEKLDPIADCLEANFTDQLKTCTSQFGDLYPVIDRDKLDQRLDQGATRVGEKSFLSPPNLGRYMNNTHIKWAKCASAELRFMTVARFVRLHNGRPTRAAFRYPEVPAWDEEIFPLNVPEGYVNWDDQLPLDAEYTVVKRCPACGGSGRVNHQACGGSGYINQTETYYSNGQNRTRTVRKPCQGCNTTGKVTCPTCTGSGKMMYDQMLVTSWKKELISTTQPKMEMHEFVEGCDEVEFSRQEYKEDREFLVKEEPTFVSETEQFTTEIISKLRSLDSNMPQWESQVEELQGGIVYRSELALTGHITICAEFGKTLKRTGWFFGCKPDFYFPMLPISYATIASWLIVPVFLLQLALLVIYVLFIYF